MKEAQEIDTTNKFMVTVTALDHITIIRPPMKPMKKEDALILAAWIVALVGGEEEFKPYLEAVENT